MLEIATTINQLRFGQLMEVYRQSNLQTGADRWPEEQLGVQLVNAEQEMYAYLRECFFPAGGIVCCLRHAGRYVSALRLEPWRDGLLLTALETAPEHRGNGYACKLILAVQEQLAEGSPVKLYSHISKCNFPSIAVHKKCGFRKVREYAVFLDGSVDSKSATYLYENE